MRIISAKAALSVLLMCCCIMVLGYGVTAAKTTISFLPYGSDPFWKDHDFDEAVARFEKENPDIDVVLTRGASGWQDYFQQVIVQTVSGIGLDVASIQPHWDATAADLFEDLSPYLKRDGLSEADFAPGTFSAMVSGAKVWGLPTMVIMRGAAYNTTITAEMGYSAPAANAWRWDDMLALAKKATVDKNGDGTTDIYGVEIGGPPRDIMYYPFATHCGGGFYDRFVDPTRSLWQSPAVREAMRFFMSFYEYGYASVTGGLFNQRRAALSTDVVVQTPEWVARTFGNYGQTIKYISTPRGPVKGGFQQGAAALQMVRGTKHPEEVWRFIKYMATSLDEIKARYSANMVEPYVSAYLKAMPLYFTYGARIVADQAAWVDIVTNPDNTPRYTLRKAADITNIAQTSLLRVARKEQALEPALIEIDRQVQALLNEAFSGK